MFQRKFGIEVRQRHRDEPELSAGAVSFDSRQTASILSIKISASIVLLPGRRGTLLAATLWLRLMWWPSLMLDLRLRKSLMNAIDPVGAGCVDSSYLSSADFKSAAASSKTAAAMSMLMARC
jgi:hypothetical protein